jgi:hypothetical protein
MTKPQFKSVEEARAALAGDKLGTVYYKASEVFVVTAFGTGKFTTAEWKVGGGPKMSIVKDESKL